MIRSEVLAQVETLLRKPNFSKEDSSRTDGLLRLAGTLTDPVTQGELRRARLRNYEREITPAATPEAVEHQRIFNAWVRGAPVEQELREAALAAGFERRALTTLVGGHSLVPHTFRGSVWEAARAADGLLAVATPVESPTGSDFSQPFLDDSTAAQVVAEGAIAPSTDLALADLAWPDAPKWDCGWMQAASELVTDSAFDVEALLARVFGARIARGCGPAWTASLLADSAVGVTTASPTALAGDEIIDLMTSVDSAELQRASWLMRLSTYASVVKLKGATSGDYLFPVSVNAEGRPVLLGFPVFLSGSMPAIAASQKVISLGNHSAFLRREVRDSMRMAVSVERWAEAGQVGFQLSVRADGKLAKSASSMPTKFLQMHA